MKADITQKRLRQLLDYDADSGVFRWKLREHSGGRCRPGDVAGTVRKDGYIVIRVDGVQHLAHRLAWVYVRGAAPKGEIDHMDGHRSHNQFSNLRDVSHAVNQQNRRRASKGNPTGVLGVCRSSSGKFVAQVRVDGRTTYHGSHETPEQAHAAYLNAKRALHPGCTI